MCAHSTPYWNALSLIQIITNTPIHTKVQSQLSSKYQLCALLRSFAALRIRACMIDCECGGCMATKYVFYRVDSQSASVFLMQINLSAKKIHSGHWTPGDGVSITLRKCDASSIRESLHTHILHAAYLPRGYDVWYKSFAMGPVCACSYERMHTKAKGV